MTKLAELLTELDELNEFESKITQRVWEDLKDAVDFGGHFVNYS